MDSTASPSRQSNVVKESFTPKKSHKKKRVKNKAVPKMMIDDDTTTANNPMMNNKTGNEMNADFHFRIVWTI